MIPLLLLAPVAGVILALLSRAPWQAALGTVVGAAGLLSGAVIQGISPRVASWGDLLRLDELGSYFLLIVAGIHFLCSVYAYGYFRRELEGGHIGPAKVRMYHVWTNLFVLSMVVVVCSHHLALQWVAVEATTLFSAPLIYLHGDRKRDGGGLEVPAHLLGRDRPGLPRDHLPLAGGRGRAADVHGASARGGSARSPLPAAGVPLLPRGVRDQDGARADAHMASGRAQPGARAGVRDDVGGPAELRPPLDPAGRPGDPRRVRLSPADPLRDPVDRGPRAPRGGPEGHQAPARLFLDREHGDRRPGARIRRRRPAGRAAARAEPLRGQGPAVPRRRGPHPAVRHAEDPAYPRDPAGVSAARRPPVRRNPRDHGIPAVRRLLERVRDPRRGDRGRAPGRFPRVPRPARDSFRLLPHVRQRHGLRGRRTAKPFRPGTVVPPPGVRYCC